jgi:hypothetical protein
VLRGDPRVIVETAHEPIRRGLAMQLRIGDLDDKDVREALATQVVRDDGRTRLDLIARRAASFAAKGVAGCPIVIATTGDVVSDRAAFELPQGRMLHEGCHRACALYESTVDRFEFCVRIDRLFDGWLVYDDMRLRAAPLPRTRSIRAQARDCFGLAPASVEERQRRRTLWYPCIRRASLRGQALGLAGWPRFWDVHEGLRPKQPTTSSRSPRRATAGMRVSPAAGVAVRFASVTDAAAASRTYW